MPALPEFTAPKKHVRCSSLKELAGLVGMSLRTLESWHRAGKISAGRDGKFGTRDVCRLWEARVEERREQLERKAAELGERGAGARAGDGLERLRLAKAARAELELAKLRGEMLDKAEVDAMQVRKILVLKQALLGFPAQVAPVLEGMDARAIEALLRSRIEGMIRNFAGEE